jgi:hypothetical protein
MEPGRPTAKACHGQDAQKPCQYSQAETVSRSERQGTRTILCALLPRAWNAQGIFYFCFRLARTPRVRLGRKQWLISEMVGGQLLWNVAACLSRSSGRSRSTKHRLFKQEGRNADLVACFAMIDVGSELHFLRIVAEPGGWKHLSRENKRIGKVRCLISSSTPSALHDDPAATTGFTKHSESCTPNATYVACCEVASASGTRGRQLFTTTMTGTSQMAVESIVVAARVLSPFHTLRAQYGYDRKRYQ